MLSAIDVQILQHGHEVEYKIIKPSKKLILVGKELEKLKFGKIILKKIELETATKESEDFMKSHFKLHKIPFQTNEVVNDHFTKNEYKSVSEIIRKYKSLTEMIDPYQLPINLEENENYRFAQLEQIGINCNNRKILAQAPVVFQGITMNNIITNCTPSILTHEITHSQINSHKGITRSLYNLEIIPIFLQLVHNLEKDDDNLEIDKVFRLTEIADCINCLTEYYNREKTYSADDLFELTKYLESTLKAFMLFEIYLNAKVNKQKEILALIQKIFNGELTVEELLEKYNITLKESSKLLQKKHL